MKKVFIAIFIGILYQKEAIATPIWLSGAKRIGEPGSFPHDYAYSVWQTTDRGYIVAGGTRSFNANDFNGLVIKLNSEGRREWIRTFDDGGEEDVRSVQQTTDGGYIIAGGTNSAGAGSWDVFVMKLSADGSREWARTFGGTAGEEAFSVRQTGDGGYIVAGWTESEGAGMRDFFVIKLNSAGHQTWARTYGGGNEDWAYSVEQTTDGGYIVAGRTYSYGVEGDFLVIKLTSEGDTSWVRTFGGNRWDAAYSIQQTTDGGYIVAGETESFGAGGDFLVIKLNSAGEQQWARTYGHSREDFARSVRQTLDGGYIVVGRTNSFGDGGDTDILVIKLNSEGARMWAGRFGINPIDLAYSVRQTLPDSGYVVVGETGSGISAYDVLVIKIKKDGSMPGCPWYSFTPVDTSRGSMEAQRTLTVRSHTWGADWQPTSDSPLDTLINACPPSVPVEEVNGFNARSEDGYVLLEWQVDVDIDNVRYFVLKRKENRDYEQIANISATSDYTYSYKDFAVKDGHWYSYKLGVVNNDNSIDWRGPVVVKYIGGTTAIYLDVLPSITNTKFHIKYRIPKTNEPVRIKLQDIGGRECKVLLDGKHSAGNYKMDLDLSNFTSGIYFLRLEVGSKAITKKLTILR